MLYRLIALVCSFFATFCVFSEEDDPQDALILSTPEQIASLTSKADYLIAGLISPLSGQPVLRQTDLVIKGAQNICLERTYISPSIPCFFPKHKREQAQHDNKYLFSYLCENYKGWQFYPHLILELNPSFMLVRVSEPNGMTLDFQLAGPHYETTSLAYLPYAITNVAEDTPSGKHDPRNTHISYEGGKITVYAADGTLRIYSKKEWARTSYVYLLVKEVLPNGKVLKYHYDGRRCLICIESLDAKERYSYASLSLSGGFPWKSDCHFTSSSGLTADYCYQRRRIHWRITGKRHGGKFLEELYPFAPPLLTAVSSPFYRNESLDYSERFLLSHYSAKDEIFTPLYAGFGEPQHFRVHKLLLPVGPNDSPVASHELFYDPPIAGQKEGTTTLKNSDGTSVIYNFSRSILTTSIQFFGKEGGLKKEKIFSWTPNHWLKAIEIRDGQNNLFFRKTYEYDNFANPTQEAFVGDLTGEGKQETYLIQRTFSQDRRNLLLQEETEDGKVICFSYLPNTNLITSKLTKDKGRILLREFFLYDDCNNLLQAISDDGNSESKDDLSGVTQRTLKTYTLRQSAPFLHMPEWIEETYSESSVEKTLKKSHLIYDQHGNVVQEEVYDSEGKHAFTICKTYNERGDVLTETNRLGQQATYTYDARGRPETSLNFSQRLHTATHYDTKGRLKQQTETGDDSVVHITNLDYDFHDRRIQKQDHFHNATHYSYDPIANEVSKTDFPSIAALDGQSAAVSTFSTYDSLGRELAKTDANGNTTTYRYNAYGSPTEITYPNGGKETFRYTKNGHLGSHTDLDGLTIVYKRDILGRVLAKTYLSESGEHLAEETFTYNGFNLLTETDKEGNTRYYFYDGAGRKIREEFCNHVTEFSYDALGRLATICKHNEENTLFIHYKRDLEGKILEESKTDSAGTFLYKISYSYDADGNQATITRYINNKEEAVESFTYDSFGRLTQQQDAEGFLSQTTYNENFVNPLGQRVLQKKTIDPRHISTLETQDALARLTKREVLDSHGATLSCYDVFHDPQGNLLYRRDHVYESGRFHSTQTVKYTYTPDHQVESLIRAFGTQDERTTTHTYFPSGKIHTKTLPNSITLTYSYHPLGFMSRLDSSDGSIRHAFTYNKLGDLCYACDEKSHIAITREIDPFGNILREVFPNDLEVQMKYDDFNRLISLRMGSQGEVSYEYDPLFLRKVIRTSSQGKTLYSHAYETYGLDGNLVSEQLIGNLGQVIHTTNLKGLSHSISSSYFSQECEYDSVGNLIHTSAGQTQQDYSYDGLFQLSSENANTFAHDSLYNRTQKNGKSQNIDALNQLLSCEEATFAYDLNGNQILKKTPSETYNFTYDPLNRLIEATSENARVNFLYDPLGRRLSKIVHTASFFGRKETREHYLYLGQNEIGAFVDANYAKNLRVLGLAQQKNNPVTIGVELEGKPYASLLDAQGNIRRLIDLYWRSLANSYDFTAFGEVQNIKEYASNPWRFAAKRFDPETGLIYFGKRYYNSQLGRWLTTDPAGFVDSSNLYQYVLNNPFRYYDPRGENLLGFLCGIGQILLGGALVATGTVIEVATCGGYTIGFALQAKAGMALMASGLLQTTYHARDIKIPNVVWKNTDVYVPDRPLPRDPRTKEPSPEANAPHTVLGAKEGTKGKYPQAREFDAQGRPVKDIDFTDHGRPQNHPNPHEHTWKPNQTGGTPSRSLDAEPLTGWRYE